MVTRIPIDSFVPRRGDERGSHRSIYFTRDPPIYLLKAGILLLCQCALDILADSFIEEAEISIGDHNHFLKR